VETNSLVFPVNFLVWIIESVRSTHFENGQVPAKCGSSIRNVGEPYAGLRNNQWIRRRWRNPLSYIRLEIDYACMCKVDVASPTGNNWVRFNAGVTVLFEEAKECFAHFWQGKRFLSSWISNERVISTFVASCFTTSFHLFVLSPEVFVAVWALFPDESFFFEEGQFVRFSWEALRHSRTPMIAVGLWNSRI